MTRTDVARLRDDLAVLRRLDSSLSPSQWGYHNMVTGVIVDIELILEHERGGNPSTAEEPPK